MIISFFGTGLMGNPMAHRLLAAGYGITVYNRTLGKTSDLKQAGADVAEEPHTGMEKGDVWILMLSDFASIESVLPVGESMDLRDTTVIQMGTIAPSESIALGQWVNGNGGEYLEAPVLGSIPQAEKGELFILVSCATQQIFKEWRPLLDHFGSRISYFGPVGRASAAKLALNQLIATETTAFSMSLGYLREQQVDIDAFMEILRESALYCPTFDKKLPRMMERDFTKPNFPLKHLLKDLELINSGFSSAGINIDTLLGVRTVIERALSENLSHLDYSALYEAIHPGDPSGDNQAES